MLLGDFLGIQKEMSALSKGTVFVAVTNTLTINNVGDKGFIWCAIPGHGPLFWGSQGSEFKCDYSQKKKE